jgi:hypothetical protein
MSASYDFVEKDLVWAKMRGSPHWPARVSLKTCFGVLLMGDFSQVDKPPAGEKSKSKLAGNWLYVLFYGTLQ